uniref:TAGL-delta n=1 Tax=Mus musculus TaxID=10090 RepID=Q71S45_MOUSE|nr:TAGL-delta [Mus musculus]
MKAWGALWIVLGLLLWPEPGAASSLPLLMDSIIQALAELEQKVPVTEASITASAWILSAKNSSTHNSLHQRLLLKAPSHNTTEPDPHSLSPELQALISEVAQHDVQNGREYGVVLAPDGSTVAVKPLLFGLEAGLQAHSVANLPSDCLAIPCDTGDTLANIRATWPGLMDAFPNASSPDVGATLPNDKAKTPTTVDRLLAITLAGDLGLTFLHRSQTWSPPGLGTEGCWDQLTAPRVFTLLDPQASRLTMAFLNGALDGALLGNHLSQIPRPHPPLSHLLREYYGAGVNGDPVFRSNFRRQNGAALTSAPTLAQQFRGRLRRLSVPGPWLALGRCAHTRLQLPRLRCGLRGQLHWVTAQRSCAEHGARRAPERNSRRSLAARLQAAWPPPASAHPLPRERALQLAAHLASLHRG